MAHAHAHAHAAVGAHAHAVKRYRGIMDWLTTVDHKKIAILYLFGGLFFFALGGLEAILIRVQLMYPQNDVLDASMYNQVLTMHGTTMIFFAAMPLLFAFMNAVVPLQIGARDVAFPFLNAFSFWVFLFGGILLNVSWFLHGAPDAGWTAYTPLSSDPNYSGRGIDFYVLGLQISGIGSLIGGINFLATIINMRAPGMTFMRMPMFTWASFVTSLLLLFAFPAITVGLVLLMFDRLFRANFFDVAAGGNVVLWQHIFWIFGHPEVYILIVPAFGIISEVLSTFSRKRLFGYGSMVFALALIGFLSFMVWAHHMFTTGMGPIANSIFAVATMLIAVPTGIKVFNWVFTIWGGQFKFTTASLFALGFIPTFTMGGVTGVMLASAAADWQYHDSYFVVAHFHYTIVGGLFSGIFAGLFYWWPKIFGRALDERLGKITFWTFTIGFHLTFFVQHFLGLWGMPRRYYQYLAGQGWDALNFVSSIGAYLMGFAMLVLVINMIITFRKPKDAPADPWDGRTLEWSMSSPAPEYNFKQIPLVRGIDELFRLKMEGRREPVPAEPVGPIHMPSPSILPFLMALGLFIAGFGFMYADYEFANGVLAALFNNYIVAGAGLALTLACMFLRSVFDDPGYHVEPDELEKGVHA